MFWGILAAASTAESGPPAYTWILGIVLGLVALGVSLKPPKAERWLRMGAAVCWIAAVEFLGLLIHVPVIARVGAAVVLAIGYLVWEFLCRADLPGPEDYVTKDHATKLKGLLEAAHHAIGHDSARTFDETAASTFSSHFPALEVQMAEWDRRAAAAAAARQSLRDTFDRELREIGADKPPYDLFVLLQGLSHITETRALRGRLREQLSPMLEGPQPVFRAFASQPVGVVSFDPSSGAAGNVATFEGDSYPLGDVGNTSSAS